MKSLLLTLSFWTPVQQPPVRYWDETPQEEVKDGDQVVQDGDQKSEQAVQQEEERAKKTKKRKTEEAHPDGKKFLSGVRLFLRSMESKNSLIRLIGGYKLP